MHSFTEKDLKQIKAKGLTPEIVEVQIKNFIDGFPYADLIGPAKVGSSIKSFDNTRIKELIQSYNEQAEKLRILKFVPASGAASRMFKHLFSFLHEAKEHDNQEELIKKTEHKDVMQFIQKIRNFAFLEDLQAALAKDKYELDSLLEEKKYDIIIEYLLTDKGLNYGALPKALLKFHRYNDHTRLAIEEHLVEGAYYARDDQDRVFIHFTVSPEHKEAFNNNLHRILPEYEKHFGVKYDIAFSTQKESTDIIAVDMDNGAFREEDGSLLFRPGGHGALIENLNEVYADLVFIKNIDNIVPDHLRDTTYIYKKVIGSYLLELQKQTFDYLNKLNDSPEDVNLEEVRLFIEDKLGYQFLDEHFSNLRRVERVDLLFDKLNRPIRVCGMVKNQGEPGGGPFCVRHDDGAVSLQIVEKAQIDTKKEDQRTYLESATHFNPVDIVCTTRNFKGEPFDLKDFIDPETGLISHKSKNGKKLKAQERPGLWNGAMADWNTAFVEVPIITFNPVKTVNDLLRKEHQPAS